MTASNHIIQYYREFVQDNQKIILKELRFQMCEFAKAEL